LPAASGDVVVGRPAGPLMSIAACETLAGAQTPRAWPTFAMPIHVTCHAAAAFFNVLIIPLVRIATLAAIVLVAASPAWSVQPADRVLRNGQIYTVDLAFPWAEAVAIHNGRFVFVGGNADAARYIGPDTDVIDLRRRFALPGMVDLHVHLFTSCITAYIDVTLPPAGSVAQVQTAVGQFAESHPDKRWIRGGYWDHTVFSGAPPHRSQLDQAVADRPVVLVDQTGESMWLNSRALEMCGISGETSAPAGGRIIRDPKDGRPSGLIRGAAQRLVLRKTPQPTRDELCAALRHALAEFAESGVTTVQTAEGCLPWLEALYELEQQDLLTLRAAFSFDWETSYVTAFTTAELEDQMGRRDDYRSELIYPDFVKLFVDGAPTGRHIAVLEPFQDDATDFGTLRISAEALANATVRFDRAGIGVKFHAIGDRAVRVALDAVEAARRSNGYAGPPHTIAHLEMVDAADIGRFRTLNVVAEFSPGITHPDPAFAAAVVPLIGRQRYEHFWPINAILETTARVAYGSAWNALPANPWPQLEGFVTRRHPRDPGLGQLNAAQAIRLGEALEMMTLGGAYAIGRDDQIGSIGEGKRADLIVVDRNPFQLARSGRHDLLSETRVLMTVFNGRVVYEAE